MRDSFEAVKDLRSEGIKMVGYTWWPLFALVGWAYREMNLPFETTTDIAEMAETMLEPFPPGEYPNLADFITEHAMKPGYDFADEFEVGLDVILDGLERVRDPA